MKHIINLENYTILEHVLFATGCLLWVFTYLIVIQKIRKEKFVEIPIIAICSNFCWEFIWSFLFTTDMGELYVWGYRLWFFLDCYIVYGLFKYGMKQVDVDAIKNNYTKVISAVLVAWFALLYYFIKIYDAPITHMGANSGYAINVMMSALYITLILRVKTLNGFSYIAGWLKGVGTLLISVFCFLHFTDAFLLNMCVVTALLDVTYIGIFTIRRKEEQKLNLLKDVSKG